jgi:hypothetical protein
LQMKLSRILNKAIDYLTEYPKRMCGSNSNNGKGVNKLIAPYDISEASIRHDESNDGLIVGPITESGLITENGRILVHK